MRSTLGRYAHLSQEPQPGQGWDACAEAWHRHGIILLNPTQIEERRGYLASKQAVLLAEQCYGKRKV